MAQDRWSERPEIESAEMMTRSYRGALVRE